VINEKRRLSIGPPPVARAIGTVVGLVFAAVGVAFAVFPFVADRFLRDLTGAADTCTSTTDIAGIPPDLLPPDLQVCAAGTGWLHDGLGPYRLIGLVGIPFALLGLYLAVKALRTAAWLDGTTLQVRGALGIRAVNLSTADITAAVVTHRTTDDGGHTTITQIPTLGARDPETGRKVSLPLQGMGTLADAITVGRPTTDGDVQVIAGQLRAMAGNPLGL
jgi:hypothetical protein